MSSSETDQNLPPIDADSGAAGNLILVTRMLIKMGTPFDDPQLSTALNQLSIWPQLVFDISGKAEISINSEERIVDFNLTFVSIPEGDDLTKRADALVAWSQRLLGEDWVVHVNSRKRKNGRYKLIHKGDRQRPFEATPPTLIDAPFPNAVSSFRRYRADGKKFGFDDEIDLGPILPKKQD